MRAHTESYLLELALRRPRLQHVRYGNRRIATGEVRVVYAATDGNPEPVPRNSRQGHVVVLPDDTFPSLKHKKYIQAVTDSYIRAQIQYSTSLYCTHSGHRLHTGALTHFPSQELLHVAAAAWAPAAG